MLPQKISKETKQVERGEKHDLNKELRWLDKTYFSNNL